MAYDNDNREITLQGISKKAEREFFDSLSGNPKYEEQTFFVDILKAVDGFLLYYDKTYEHITPTVQSHGINMPSTSTVSHLKNMTFPGTPVVNFSGYEQLPSTVRSPQAENLFDAVRIAWHRNKYK